MTTTRNSQPNKLTPKGRGQLAQAVRKSAPNPWTRAGWAVCGWSARNAATAEAAARFRASLAT